MGPLDLLMHLMGFVAPAAGVALLVSLFARLALRGRPAESAWWASFAVVFVAGVLALTAGLWLFGRDGKILAYAALVLACGTAQWFAARGWR